MSPTERLAIAAHLHVLLRRKTGRVTDTEWMAHNAEYAAEIVRFARLHAEKDGHLDLAEWATRLERAMARMEAPRRPLVAAASEAVRERLNTQPPPVVVAPSAGPSGPISRSDAGTPSPQPQRFEDTTGFRESTFRESTFRESTLGEDPDAPGTPRDKRGPPKPRYVGGIR